MGRFAKRRPSQAARTGRRRTRGEATQVAVRSSPESGGLLLEAGLCDPASPSPPESAPPFPRRPNGRFAIHVFSLFGCSSSSVACGFSARNCRCGLPLGSGGHHHAACAVAWGSGTQGFAVESAAARVCREAGARVLRSRRGPRALLTTAVWKLWRMACHRSTGSAGSGYGYGVCPQKGGNATPTMCYHGRCSSRDSSATERDNVSRAEWPTREDKVRGLGGRGRREVLQWSEAPHLRARDRRGSRFRRRHSLRVRLVPGTRLGERPRLAHPFF